MPPKRNRQRNKNRAGQEGDQAAPSSQTQIRDDDDDDKTVEPSVQYRGGEGRRDQPRVTEGYRDQPRVSEGYRDQPRVVEGHRDQPKGAEGYRDQPRGTEGYRDQPRGTEGYRDQPRGAEGYRDQPRGTEGYRDQPRGTEGYRDQPRVAEGYKDKPRVVEGHRDQPKGAEGYRDQPRGTEGYRDQPRGAEGYRDQTRGAEGYRDQPRGAEGYRDQHQHPQFRGPQEYGGPTRQFQQKDPRGNDDPLRQRGQETLRQQSQQGPPRSAGALQQPSKQIQEPQMHQQQFSQEKAPDSFRQPSQRGSEITKQPPPQTQQRLTEEFRPLSQKVQQGESRAFRVQPQQGQQKVPDTVVMQAPPPHIQRQGPDLSQPSSQKSEGPWKKPGSDFSKSHPSEIQPQRQGVDDIEQLQPKLSALALEKSEATVKVPTTDPTKPKSEYPSTVSSSSPADSASIKPLSKKMTLLKLNMNISQTMQQKFLPKRPDPGGKKGREIKLIINCLDMKIKPMKIYMYDIELTKAETTSQSKKRDVKVKVQKKDTLRQVVYGFLKDKGGLPVFDGSKIIFTNEMLPINNDIVNKIEFKYIVDDEEVSCHFNLQRVKEENIELSTLTHYVESGQGRSDNLPQEALRALDTIMKEMFINKNLISLNRRAIFDPKTSKPLRCGPYLLMEGYATTVRPHMWKIRFNFDKTQIVLHKPMNLYDYLRELTSDFRNFRPDITKKKIHLLRVESNHLKNPDGKSYIRRYTIHGFSRGNAKTEKIEEKNITIEQYFLKEYNIKLKYPNMELIKTNPNKKTYIPMELLTVLPHQKVLANDPAIVQEVIRAAALPAFDRLQNLRNAIKTLKFGDRADKYIKNYMIEIDDNLINVSGRILEGPEAQFGGGNEHLRGGKWDFRRKRFFKPHPNMVNWALFAVGTGRDYQRDEQRLYDIEEQLPDASGRVGVKMDKMFFFTYISWQRIEIEVPEIIARSEKEKKRLDLLVFVINRDEDYKAVKRFGDMTYGIVTQCMKLGTLSRQKAMDQYLANIMLKINTKLGGINWELLALVNKNFSPIKGRFMVFGIDVTHPAATRSDLQKSIAAMVGSLDNTASLYSAVIRQQISKEERSIIEVVLDTDEMVHKLLMNFYQANKTLKPDHLIFYRDGVSEGQFAIVFKHEIVAIQNACTRLQADYQPKITYIVVQKRHKIRFFPTNEKDAIGRSGNVPSGTVVDKDITHCREFDFYLCSHEGIQGTSKPAHYHVLYDENNWGSDDLQSFTYFLCHVYARSTRSVSYPAPTYYAHLAAFRGRALIGEVFDDSSSSASGQTAKVTESRDSEIVIHDYHNNKLFFI